MAYNPRDRYFIKAKEQGYAARSIFKLEEIDQKFKIFKSGEQVLDLGASPGSWSQYSSKKIGSQGRLLGIDLSPVTVKLDNAVFIQADLRDVNLEQLIEEQGFVGGFDIVLSDMAPKTTGIKFTDQMRSLELCELALDTAKKYLKKNGHFVCKFFHSEHFAELRDKIKKDFRQVQVIKPDSTRSISKEIFLVGLSKR